MWSFHLQQLPILLRPQGLLGYCEERWTSSCNHDGSIPRPDERRDQYGRVVLLKRRWCRLCISRRVVQRSHAVHWKGIKRSCNLGHVGAFYQRHPSLFSLPPVPLPFWDLWWQVLSCPSLEPLDNKAQRHQSGHHKQWYHQRHLQQYVGQRSRIHNASQDRPLPPVNARPEELLSSIPLQHWNPCWVWQHWELYDQPDTWHNDNSFRTHPVHKGCWKLCMHQPRSGNQERLCWNFLLSRDWAQQCSLLCKYYWDYINQ